MPQATGLTVAMIRHARLLLEQEAARAAQISVCAKHTVSQEAP